MRIGVVISGGDVSGINNFIFQIARLMQADITLFNGGIPGLLEKKHNEIAWRDLVDFSIASIPIITSGRTTRKLVRSEYEIIAKKLRSLRIDVLVMAGGDGSLQFLNTLSEFDVNCFGVGMTIDNDVYGSDYSIGFSTACEQIIKEVSRLRNTGRALPGRVFMVEVLGGYCGELTLQSAIKAMRILPLYRSARSQLMSYLNALQTALPARTVSLFYVQKVTPESTRRAFRGYRHHDQAA
jgi:6-phosphofructokinase 1